MRRGYPYSAAWLNTGMVRRGYLGCGVARMGAAKRGEVGVRRGEVGVRRGEV